MAAEALRLARQRKRQLVIEVFSGAGAISHYLRALGYAVISIDTCINKELDVTSSCLLDCLVGWARCGMVLGLWLAPPCTTWSIAHTTPPLRSAEWPMGLPNLAPAYALKVASANRVFKATLRIAKVVIVLCVPCMLENPLTSRMFLASDFQRIIGHTSPSYVACDMCQFGARWRTANALHTWQC